MKTNTMYQQCTKSMGLSKMSSKRELYSNTDLPQETGKALNYLTFTPNGARKRKTKKGLKLVKERN